MPIRPKWNTRDPYSFGRGKLRTCYTLHRCEICGHDIRAGDEYYERSGHRAHDGCVYLPAKSLEGGD